MTASHASAALSALSALSVSFARPSLPKSARRPPARPTGSRRCATTSWRRWTSANGELAGSERIAYLNQLARHAAAPSRSTSTSTPSAPAPAGPMPTRWSAGGGSTISRTPTTATTMCGTCGSWASGRSRSIRFAPDSTIVRFALPAAARSGRIRWWWRWTGSPALHTPAAPGATGPGLRLCPVVSQGRGVRHARLGGASALPGGRVLRRVRDFPRAARPARGPGDGRDRRAAVRRPGVGAGQPRCRTEPRRVPARLLPDRRRSCSSMARHVASPVRSQEGCVWYAEDVHHFAMSMNPDYRYEGGRCGDVAVHVLYQPGDTDLVGPRRRGPADRERRWSGSTGSSAPSPGRRSPTCTGSRAAAPSSR